ncbi:tryptophan--tRNA ligase [Spiroplasma endosymbiont of Amphibalanus improvisus]|uniref:tryptophan--tRNA ligase n=1 Tax=Spiroplasma endosymbiont of Amphibalanus improvisus TaxID=3066327 RepID=UPI00313BDD88
MIKHKTIVSGITSTGDITIGNYIGAIRHFVELQDKNNLFIFVANLHGITNPAELEREELKNNIKNMFALYFACGLDPEKITLFVQSDVLEHANLAHILLCHSTIGELQRMTQFKDKSKIKGKNGSDYIPSGLLTYPTLMAADILLYDGELVPVGKDQKQHIELTRNLAIRLNNKTKTDLFTIPEPYIATTGSKIKDLQNPDKKMSKSSENPKSFIRMLDEPAVVIKKINSAVTDSENKIYYDEVKKPGVSNLLTIYSCLRKITIEEAVVFFEGKNYGEFKQEISKEINILLSDIQKKYNNLINSKKLDELIIYGANKARKVAHKKIELVFDKLGLNYK